MPLARMYLLNCITHKRFVRGLLMRLCSIEAIELCDIRKTPLYKKGYLLSMVVDEREEEEIASIKGRLLRIFENLDAQPPPLKDTLPYAEGKEILSPEESRLLEEIEVGASRLGATKEVLLRSKERIKTYLFKVHNLLGIDVRIEDLRNLKYLYYSFGMVPSAQMPRLMRNLENIPHVIVPVKEDHIFVFGLRRDKEKIEDILKTVFFERIELPTKYRGEPENAAKLIDLEVKRLDLALENLKIRMKRFFYERESFLNELWQRVIWRDLSIKVKKFCGRTNYLVVVSGWVPEDKRGLVESIIEETCEGKAIYEWLDAREVEELNPPTLMRNISTFKPFESLIRLYGTPSYNEVDPTPFVALSYPFFFGFMFGDLGQGAVLYLLSKLGEMKMPSFKNLFSLIRWCSISSMIFGFLYGHIFGFSDLMKPLILSPMHDIHSMIRGSVFIGVLFLVLGNLISLIVQYRMHGFGREFLLGRHGVAGFLFFLSLISVFLLWKRIGALALLLPLPPAFMIYLGLREDNPMEGFFYPLISIIETFSKVVSFIRLGAFALNHSLLFMAFFMLGKMFEGSLLGSFGSIIMIILGNALIIILEGLVVGIQALRLNLYEFFSSFYKGEGRPFKPLSLRNTDID